MTMSCAASVGTVAHPLAAILYIRDFLEIQHRIRSHLFGHFQSRVGAPITNTLLAPWSFATAVAKLPSGPLP